MKEVVYDKSFNMHTIEIKRTFFGAYFVYLDDLFFCSADTINEAEQDVDELISERSYVSGLSLT